MASSTKATENAVATPTTVDGARLLMCKLQRLEQTLEAIPLVRDRKVAAIKEEAAQESAKVKKNMAPIIKALVDFAQAHRETLTDGDRRKSAEISPGTIKWRYTPRAIQIARGKLAEVIEAIKANLRRFGKFRVQPEIKLNRQAMIRDPERALELPHISIGQSEVLVIELEDVRDRVVQRLRLLTTAEMADVPPDLVEIEGGEDKDNED